MLKSTVTRLLLRLCALVLREGVILFLLLLQGVILFLPFQWLTGHKVLFQLQSQQTNGARY